MKHNNTMARRTHFSQTPAPGPNNQHFKPAAKKSAPQKKSNLVKIGEMVKNAKIEKGAKEPEAQAAPAQNPKSAPILRSADEAWKIVAENEGLIPGAMRGHGLQLLGVDEEDVKAALKIALFETALRWNAEKGTLATYYYARAKKCKAALMKEARHVRFNDAERKAAIDYLSWEKYYPGKPLEHFARFMEITMREAEDAKNLAAAYNSSRKTGSAHAILYSERDIEGSATRQIESTNTWIRNDAPAFPGRSVFSPDRRIPNSELRRDIISTLDVLNPQEREVIELLFLHPPGQPGSTLEEVGKKMGVSKNRIDDILQKALRKLRFPEHSLLLREHLGENSR